MSRPLTPTRARIRTPTPFSRARIRTPTPFSPPFSPFSEMNPFTFGRASDVNEAVRDIAEHRDARFIAGGTNILDLMRENVARPARLIDITRLPLRSIEATADGGLRLGALATNA